MINRILSLATLLLFLASANAQVRFTCNGEKMSSAKDCLYVNPKMKTRESRFCFNNVKEALLFAEKHPSNHSTIYIEPYVYWLDDPNDTTIRKPLQGENEPFGMKLRISNVSLIGLSSNPKDIVLACNRGQTQGAVGNFTMLHITGDNIHAENITFGNYCNVDLDYKPNPKLSRKKRGEAIVQAQLILCRGKNYSARNCEFISRLNSCPFVGADDVHFEKCYFECTDDALCGTGIYDDCNFTFYSSKPFYCTSTQGATLRNCNIHSKVSGTQYLTKVSDPVTMINCHWTSDDKDLKIEWARKPNPKKKCLAEGCTLNSKPLILPPTPDVPMPVAFPYLALENQPDIIPGRWTLDGYKPEDTKEFGWTIPKDRAAWCMGEGCDGAEGCKGIIQNIRGARMMYTAPENETFHGQKLTISLDPCKSKGQGFGSATGQYMDICIKFDTHTLTGYGIRFMRTPEYDNAVVVYLVEYSSGKVSALTKPEKCVLFKRGCKLILSCHDTRLMAEISNGEEKQTLIHTLTSANSFGGIHIQHTGSTGGSATVISGLEAEYLPISFASSTSSEK